MLFFVSVVNEEAKLRLWLARKTDDLTLRIRLPIVGSRPAATH